MAIELEAAIKKLLDDPETVKVLASISREGKPHVSFKGSIHVNDQGNLEYYEIIESSQTNKNLVHSIWFHKQVAINILGKNKQSFQIKGTPVKALIYGKEFEKHYKKIKAERGQDLSTVWIIEPEEIIEETFIKRKTEEEAAHPLFRHLDTLLSEVVE